MARSTAVTDVFYANLVRVGKVKIDWTLDMTRHFDLNERSRTLRLFAHPSYCALICLSDPASTKALSRLLANDGELPPSSRENQEPASPFDDYCRETLVTLGIIFSQDGRSRKQAQDNAGNSWNGVTSEDEVLLELCTKRWNDHVLFNHLMAPPVRANYSAHVDFPFLGEKLLKLRDYMVQQSPNDFYTLILGRRDPLRFWTFASGVVLASISILVSLAQTGIAIGALVEDMKGEKK